MAQCQWRAVTAALTHLSTFSCFLFLFVLLEHSLQAVWKQELLFPLWYYYCFFFSLFSGKPVRSPIAYSRNQVLALSRTMVPPYEWPNVLMWAKIRGSMGAMSCAPWQRRCCLSLLKTTNRARNLGVIMDSDLNFSSDTKTILVSLLHHSSS